jgi:hypothetical protein
MNHHRFAGFGTQLNRLVSYIITRRHHHDHDDGNDGPSTIMTRIVLPLSLLLAASLVRNIHAFLPSVAFFGRPRLALSIDRPRLHVSTANEKIPTQLPDDEHLTDEELLTTTPKSKFISLCESLGLPTAGTKQELLGRLRDHAKEQAEGDRRRKLERLQRVQQGIDSTSKERYEVVSDEPEVAKEEEEGYFYFSLPETMNGTANATISGESAARENRNGASRTQQYITAPPPPDKPNEKGERVVTTYSSTDQNDMTTTNSLSNRDSVSMMESSSYSSHQPWDSQQQQKKQQKTPIELQEAKETVTELVRSLLILSGAPGFHEDFDGGLQPLDDDKDPILFTKKVVDYVGFDASKVPADVLTTSSKALRAGRGRILQEVLNEFELEAIGYDGMAGDEKRKGGGHYQQVRMIGAFLEGFRRAEVRLIARETTTLLLDRVASEGVQGLDRTLSTMSKSSDDSGEAGELSDSLLDFLNDMIREQESKTSMRSSNAGTADGDDLLQMDHEDALDKLWIVTSEDDKRIETLDPQDPKVKEAIEKFSSSESDVSAQALTLKVPSSVPEKLLLLLRLLRDRLKAEAAFGNDEKGRNLRILAYCLRFDCGIDRQKLLNLEFGKSLDRLDSFLELVASSIEYGESTSAQLQPGSQKLNLALLREIYQMARDTRDRMSSAKKKGR